MAAKDRVSAAHEASKSAGIAKLPSYIFSNEKIAGVEFKNPLKDNLSSAFDRAVTTMGIQNPLESEAASETIAQEFAAKDIVNEMQGQDPEYVVSLLTMLGLMPAADDPETKAIAFKAYVKNIQDCDPVLEAKIDSWAKEDSEEKLAENLKELIASAQKADFKEDQQFMRDIQDEQNLLISLAPEVINIPKGGLNKDSSRPDIRLALDQAVKVAKQRNPKAEFSEKRLVEMELLMHSILKDSDITSEEIHVSHDGEINFVLSRSAQCMGLKIMPDAVYEEMKLKGEAATVQPGLKIFTEKPGDISNNFSKGTEVKAAVGANPEIVTAVKADIVDNSIPEANISRNTSPNPFDTNYKPGSYP